MTSLAKSAQEIAADTRQTVQRARQAIESLQEKDGQVAGVTEGLKETLDGARTAMAGLSENMEALKRGFFFPRILQPSRLLHPWRDLAGGIPKRRS